MKVLMVDVDGVLVHGRPADGLPLFTYLEQDLGLRLDILQQAFFKRHWADIVIGREPMEPRLASVLREIAPDLKAETLIDYWFENDSRLDTDLLDALAGYRARSIRLFLATNQEHMRATYLLDRLGLRTYFDGIFYSAAFGCRKPDAAFFRLATEGSGAAPEEIGFIDDVAENVEAARRFGWHAAQWTRGMRLEEALPPNA